MNHCRPSRNLDRRHGLHELCGGEAACLVEHVPYHYTHSVSFTLNQYTGRSNAKLRNAEEAGCSHDYTTART